MEYITLGTTPKIVIFYNLGRPRLGKICSHPTIGRIRFLSSVTSLLQGDLLAFAFSKIGR